MYIFQLCWDREVRVITTSLCDSHSPPQRTLIFSILRKCDVKFNVFSPFSAGTDFRLQNLTSKVNPHTKSEIFIMDVNHNIGIQMNQEELTKTFMMN